MSNPQEVVKAPDRAAVLEKIALYEKEGKFHLDVESDPPWNPVDISKLDLLRKKFSSKIKTMVAYRFASKYFKGMLRSKTVIWNGVQGLENLGDYQGGAIVTCNHIHQFDNYAVMIGLRKHFKKMKHRIVKVVREGNYSFPGWVGFFMRNCDTLPVNERENQNLKLTAKVFQTAKIMLQNNRKILVFPEQGMWWNYRKPRPMKKGAFFMAARHGAPVIPCFFTLKDSEVVDKKTGEKSLRIGKDGFPVQEFTLHVGNMIYPDSDKTLEENAEIMMQKNAEVWKEIYERIYGIPLIYTTVKKGE
jgi:1-acyl-sn-glycerol-3-phosphate acyltransferase